MAYSLVSDLLLGEIPLPPYVTAATYIDNAAEEIDAVIGLTYVTPVSIQETSSTRPTKLLLKKANNFLATGRIIMAIDSSGQNKELHRYGRYLIAEAEKIVQSIASGEIVLVGAIPQDSVGQQTTAPIIDNQDSVSFVDEYYTNFNWDNHYPSFPRRRVSFGEDV